MKANHQGGKIMNNENVKEEIKKYAPILILLVGSFIVIIVVLSLTNPSSSTNNDNKYVKEVETSKSSTGTYKASLPEILLDSESAKTINSLLKETYDMAKSEDDDFNYSYTVNKNYLSLVATYTFKDDETSEEFTNIETYNFSLKTKEQVDNSTLLDAFNTDFDKIIASFKKILTTYYNEEVESMYFTKKECDFTCFLKNHELENYEDPSFIKLYVEGNKLKFYRYFKTNTIYGEEQFFRNKGFLFTISN